MEFLLIAIKMKHTKKMDKLKWCCEQKKGISIIEPNKNLSEEYIKKADESLEAMLINKKGWKIITAYYACYNALYSILMLAGIKSEIHECSIELMNLIDEFKSEDIHFLKGLKKDRIDVQYYLKDRKLEDEDQAKAFVLKCKQILMSINPDKVRNKIKEAMK